MTRSTATTITDDGLDDLYERLATAAHIADTLLCTTHRRTEIVITLRDLCAGDIAPGHAIAQIAA